MQLTWSRHHREVDQRLIRGNFGLSRSDQDPRQSQAKDGKGGSYSDWSKQDLLKRAKQIGIKGRSAMNKKQLVNALRNH